MAAAAESQDADQITPLRVMAAFTAMTTLLMVFAIQRVLGDERIELPKPGHHQARAEQPPPADLQKTDRKPLIPVEADPADGGSASA